MYETEPVGEVLDQRAFYNAVLRVETRLGPERLLDACKAVERAFGRTLEGEDGYVKHGPRAIDVDLLLLGEVEYSSERLTLPHREVMTRRFVLVPLLELAPGPGAAGPRAGLRRAGAHRRTGRVRGRPAAGDRAVKLLVVDVGNTQTHLGVYADGELVHDWRFATVRESTSDELGAALRALLALRGLEFSDLDASIVSSTVPTLRPQWTGMAVTLPLATRCCWWARA